MRLDRLDSDDRSAATNEALEKAADVEDRDHQVELDTHVLHAHRRDGGDGIGEHDRACDAQEERVDHAESQQSQEGGHDDTDEGTDQDVRHDGQELVGSLHKQFSQKDVRWGKGPRHFP